MQSAQDSRLAKFGGCQAKQGSTVAPSVHNVLVITMYNAYESWTKLKLHQFYKAQNQCFMSLMRGQNQSFINFIVAYSPKYQGSDQKLNLCM